MNHFSLEEDKYTIYELLCDHIDPERCNIKFCFIRLSQSVGLKEMMYEVGESISHLR